MNKPLTPDAILDAKLERADRLEQEAKDIRRDVRAEMLSRCVLGLINVMESEMGEACETYADVISQARALALKED